MRSVAAFIIFLILPLSAKKFSGSHSTIRTLRTFLLKDYDVNARPVFNHQNVTVVDIGFEPVHITDMNENRGILTLEVRVFMGWYDDHLKWDPKDYFGLEELRLGEKEIWKPDVAVWENRGNQAHPWHSISLNVNSTGYVVWLPGSTLQVYCGEFDYENYPNDKQTCVINLGPWAYNMDNIVLRMDQENETFYGTSYQNPHWELVDLRADHRTLTGELNDSYASIEYELEIERMNVPFSALCSVPDSVVRVLVLSMFWIVGATRKYLIGCTALLILSTIAVGITVSLPSPAAAPFALYEVSCTMGLTMAALVVEIVVITLAGCTLGLPSWMDNLAGSSLCRALTLCQSPKASSKDDREDIITDVAHNQPPLWPVLATILDRIAFIVFAILLLAL